MLLSNITSHASTCASLLSLKVPVLLNPSATPPYYPPQSRSGTSIPPSPYPSGDVKDVQALPLLVQAFVQGAKVDTTSEQRTRKGDLHFLASVFANVSMSGTDGELEYPLSELVVFTEHADTIRRGGVTSTIKHCAFHVPAHKAILFSETERASIPPSTVPAPGINALPYILLPLAGPEEFDLDDQEKLHEELQLLPETKKREVDDVLRLTHVETLILLCTTRAGRECLRSNGVYEIMRVMHISENVENIIEHIERLVNLLKGEEAPFQDGDDDGWSHRLLNADTVTPGESNGQTEAVEGSMDDSELNTASMGSLLADEDEDEMIVEV
ncbi:hypothetical protein EW145_g2835 [Phellinidium pouzarii]|uniref:Protein HGH1 homolog n=1 Tax=Phellinidium pouzarii TaxID=167371 RepID=A0A4S4LAY7_9AGAM|nr:hypothetical protein EW145_g2835 [Phellinidium pouzarii]